MSNAFAFGQTPSANFTASPLAGCSPLIVNFQDLSTGSPTAWSWDFGNGNTSILQNPSTTYFVPGNYTVRLTVTNANGSNTLTRSQYITVYDLPVINFSASNQSGCFPLPVQFTDLSTGGAGNTNVSWQWDFGNGVTSTLQNPFITYTIAGNYSITLRVTNDKGCTKVISRPNFIVVTPGVTTGFNFNQPSVCASPADINFTNTSTGPPTLSYLWDFGDGNTSTVQNPLHTYLTNGTYTVTLVTRSSGGCQDTTRHPVSIGGFVTSFTNPATICAEQPASFTNTSVPVPTSALWVFGDGNTSTQINPSYAYTTPGTYTIRLYNTYTNCIDSTTGTITVHPLPAANFTAPVTARCEPPFTVNFQDISSGAVSWQWNFGDGNISTLQHPSHTYTNYGSYNVSLIVTNTNGCTDTIIQPNFIRVQRAVIAIPSLPIRGCIPFTISPVANITAIDAITSYSWDFGDGGTSNISNPTHTYNTQGTYTIKLLITTSTGCSDSLIIVNAVRAGTNPIPDFSASPIPVCAYQPVQFTDLSTSAATPPIDEWLWNFGDGSTSTLQNPQHIYTDTGYFTITLTATNNGCPATITKTNYIQVLPPIARFTFAIADCGNRALFQFTDQSIGPITTYDWDFGDGSPHSFAQNPLHSFPALGTYSVILTVTNGSCSHSITNQINIVDQAPNFTASSIPICRGNILTLTPSNFDPALTTSLLWDFGNGIQTTTAATAVNYLYPASGTYTIRLIATDVNGCRDTITRTNYIRVNGPLANFSATNTAGCTGLVTLFNDLSATDGVNNIVRWQWNFGDGNTQTFTSPPFQHTYNTAGTFSVKLVVTDASGCSDSLSIQDIVTATDPVPDFVSPDTLSCPNAIVTFINTSVATGFTSSWDFGDGNTSTITSPVHNYANTGNYTVKLFITDAYGCIDSVIKTNYIRISEPNAGFTVNDSISSCLPFEVQFTDTSSYYTSLIWSFGDGATSTQQNPSHYFSAHGIYRVKLLITSRGGCQDSAFVNITVNDTTGSTITYTPLAGCNPLLVNLTTSTSAIIDSYFWDFGDGTTITSTSPTISHLYNSFGDFIPKVIMLDPSGCLIPLTGLNTIQIQGSVPDFGFSDSLLCDSGYVAFSDSTTFNDPITNWQWNFGDGNTSILQNPVHYYNTPGIFDVTLSTTTQSGCQNSITIPAAVKVVLRPLIDIAGNISVCIYDSLLHSGIFLRPDTSVVTWQWVFPNGNTSTLQNPPYQTYSVSGSFPIIAMSMNSSGCRDTTTQLITVNPLPTVTMPGQMTIQAGFPQIIPAVYSAGVNSWLWSPAPGLSCTDCPQPIAGPKFNTDYFVYFINANGCKNLDTIQITVICKEGNLYIPNTFSPNNDGSNDRFYPRGKGLHSVKSMQIYNRWGEIVFENKGFQVNDILQGWDGTYKGKKPQADVYIYQIEIYCDNGDLIKLSGNIALIL
ncbi:MAG: PKD domain-containing protein [Chitinophagaceae bacterium]